DVSGRFQFIRLIGAATDNAYRIALQEFEVYGSAQTELISLQKNVQTSTDESLQTRLFAVDGNASTLWISAFASGQWITVDLGEVHAVDRIVLDWEAYYDSGYRIEGSVDNAIWASIAQQANNSGCMEEHANID